MQQETLERYQMLVYLAAILGGPVVGQGGYQDRVLFRRQALRESACLVHFSYVAAQLQASSSTFRFLPIRCIKLPQDTTKAISAIS